MRAAWPFAAFRDIPCETRWSLIASYCFGIEPAPPIDRVIVAPPELWAVNVISRLYQRVGAHGVVRGVCDKCHIPEASGLSLAGANEAPLEAVASVPRQDAHAVEIADVIVAVGLL